VHADDADNFFALQEVTHRHWRSGCHVVVVMCWDEAADDMEQEAAAAVCV
jgi:hypothetical protein